MDMNNVDVNRLVEALEGINGTLIKLSSHVAAVAYFLDKDEDKHGAISPFCNNTGCYKSDCTCSTCKTRIE